MTRAAAKASDTTMTPFSVLVTLPARAKAWAGNEGRSLGKSGRWGG
jgi:hypothetical protein